MSGMPIDLVLTRLSPTRTQALHDVAAGHQVHGREISGLRAWGLIHADHTLTSKGRTVLAHLKGQP